MLVTLNTLVKKTIEHKKFYIKKNKRQKILSPTKVFIYNIAVK